MTTPARKPIDVTIYGGTDVGLIRDHNEDWFDIADLDAGAVCDRHTVTELEAVERGPVLIVCDGMGGAAGGEVASHMAAEVVWSEMKDTPATRERAVYARYLRRAVREANRRVFERARNEPELRGMGTTLSAAGMVGDALLLAQVGDSRAYIRRNDRLTQITRDQSIVSALISAGRLTEREARSYHQSNVILQALGVSDDVEVALSIAELRRGDWLLLCSDGLHGHVPTEALHGTVCAEDEPVKAVKAAIALARTAGGPDNITALVAIFDGEGLKPPLGSDDQPRFVEFDPMEEGEAALSTTSRVGRRLAARAGVTDDPGPLPIPATGQHRAVRAPNGGEGGSGDGDVAGGGPASAALQERARIGLLAWAMAVIALIAVGALLLWDRL